LKDKKSVLALAIFSIAFILISGCVSMPPSLHASPVASTNETPTPHMSVPASVSASAPGPAPSSTDLVVYYIDVGQGDSELIQYGGKNMLIDAGPTVAGSRVSKFLKAHGVSSIDVLVSTHPHEDHIGGMLTVLNDFPVKVVYDSGRPHTTQTYEQYLTLIDKKNIKYVVPEAGDIIDFAPGVKVQVLSAGVDSDDLNEQSIVMKVAYGDTSFLFTGDIGFDAESSLLKSGYNLKSDVLKVGHHGSRHSSGTSFLKAVDPKYSVIEVGADNSYNHPSKQALGRLQAAGSTVYRTDYDGTVEAASDGKGVIMSAERRAPA